MEKRHLFSYDIILYPREYLEDQYIVLYHGRKRNYTCEDEFLYFEFLYYLLNTCAETCSFFVAHEQSLSILCTRQ